MWALPLVCVCTWPGLEHPQMPSRCPCFLNGNMSVVDGSWTKIPPKNPHGREGAGSLPSRSPQGRTPSPWHCLGPVRPPRGAGPMSLVSERQDGGQCIPLGPEQQVGCLISLKGGPRQAPRALRPPKGTPPCRGTSIPSHLLLHQGRPFATTLNPIAQLIKIKRRTHKITDSKR